MQATSFFSLSHLEPTDKNRYPFQSIWRKNESDKTADDHEEE